ncbi:MAG: indole-3-glycerol phosphate synthase TrpC [Micrococcales bacterium]|nr:indole-3-glycerol phosphate synthase TrpC [Micrococcales bacterium]
MTVLDAIVKSVRQDLAARQQVLPLDHLKQLAQQASTPKDALSALSQSNTVSVIAEVKRCSPSKGHLATIPDPGQLAGAYEEGGAACISVLTEAQHFGGCLADLQKVRRTVDVPVMRKDFVVSSYQVFEARAYGADLILLIAAVLEQEALVSLIERTASLGMTALVEAHTEDEVDRAIAAGADLIGINARNLATLSVDRSVFGRLAQKVPANKVLVAESGVSGPNDLVDYARAGANAVLVGEYVSVATDPAKAVAELVAVGAHPSIQRVKA